MIQTTEGNGVTTLTMSHGAANALDLEFCLALTEKLGELQKARQAVVLTGTGRIFSAGVDLKRVLADDVAYSRDFLRALDGLFRALLEFDRPLVAAINGHAIAGGCVIAQTCDLRIMSEGKGRIGVPELQVGVPFPPYALEALRQGFPPHVFAKLAYAGRTYHADIAFALGIVDQLEPAEDLLIIAQEQTTRFAKLSDSAFSLSKRQRNAPALAQAARNQEAFGADIEREWLSDETRSRISDYVERVLGG